ncbi:DUF2254 domain-containing protein [Streptomyces canus]|nr:DUF2254 domain-containing protein [Streptomyces canus]
MVLGVVLAELAIAADGVDWPPSGWRYSATTASGVLSAIVGAMVALLGFVVTIGVLVIQQATGALSPRYMRLWYRDRLQKTVLATFTGTFAFAFSLLRSIESNSVPDFGVTLAGAAVAVSLLLLLVYLNRFTHNLRPVAIADLVGRMGEDVFARGAMAVRASAPHDGEPLTVHGPVTLIHSPHGGAIQAFDVAGLVAAGVHHDCTFVVPHLIGDYVPPGAVLVEVHGGTSAPDPRHMTSLIALGAERTIEQDPAFALRILVDIAIRALSPAVNDPTTAVQVLNHIESFLTVVGSARLRDRYVMADDRGGLVSSCTDVTGRTICNSPSPRSVTTGRPPCRSADGCAPRSTALSRVCRQRNIRRWKRSWRYCTSRWSGCSRTRPAEPSHSAQTLRVSAVGPGLTGSGPHHSRGPHRVLNRRRSGLADDPGLRGDHYAGWPTAGSARPDRHGRIGSSWVVTNARTDSDSTTTPAASSSDQHHPVPCLGRRRSFGNGRRGWDVTSGGETMSCPPRHRGVHVELQAIALSVEPVGRIGQGAVDRRIAPRHERLVSVDIESDLGGLRSGSGIHAEAVGSDAAHLAGDGWLYSNAPIASARWPARGGPQGRER